MNKLFLISMAIIACILNGTRALQCYDCYGNTENIDIECGNVYDIVTCSENDFYCISQHTAYTRVEPNGVTNTLDVVVRKCASALSTRWTQEPYCEKGEEQARSYPGTITEYKCDVSACTTDLCNIGDQ